MVNKLLALLFTSLLALPLSTAGFAQEAPAKAKAAKDARWEGNVIRSSPDKSTLTVRNVVRVPRKPSSTTARRDGSVRRTAAKRSTTLMPPRLKIMIA